ncbi:MAG: 1-acyl-sn-glycerol-3-phosphate acyltransferase [Cytophagales bacterium]|nr:1-acyl-sn-glycerol-3-phosphate acyltransferase [Cytophagales bacterium]
MRRWLAKLFFKLFGWKIGGALPQDIKKAVILCVPHTSNWDFIYGMMVISILKIPAKFVIKKEAMFFPLGTILKWIGAIPIDRKQTNKKIKMVEVLVNLVQEAEELMIVIAPEGTRSYRPRWKTGFYHIAMKAKVPIIFAYLDYQKKKGGLGPVFYPTGNLQEDMKHIQSFYKDKVAKYPEKVSKMIVS